MKKKKTKEMGNTNKFEGSFEELSLDECKAIEGGSLTVLAIGTAFIVGLAVGYFQWRKKQAE
jgi:hypothetical protein